MADTESEERKAYLEERKLLIEMERSGSLSFDKAIITLSAGALGMSITFIRQLAPVLQDGTLSLLIVAWLGFGLALLATLFSFLSSQAAIRTQREILDQWYQCKQSTQDQINWKAKVTNWLNWSSIVFFIVGVIFLAFFTLKNLPNQEDTMLDKTGESQTPPEKRGVVPPNPPVQPNQPGQNPGSGKKQ